MSLLGKWIINRDGAPHRRATEVIGLGVDCVFVPAGRVPNYDLPKYRLATDAEIRAAKGGKKKR